MSNINDLVNSMSFLSDNARKELINGVTVGVRQSYASKKDNDLYSIEDELQGCRTVQKTLTGINGSEFVVDYHESRGKNVSVDGKAAIVLSPKVEREVFSKLGEIMDFSRQYSKENPVFTIADEDIPTADGGFIGQQGLTDYETTEFASYILRPYLADISDINNIARMNFVVGNKLTTSIYFTQIAQYANWAYNNWSENFPARINTASSLLVARTASIKTGVKFSQIQEQRAAVRRFSKIGLEKAFAPEYLSRIELSTMYSGLSQDLPDGTIKYFTTGIATAKGLLPILTALPGVNNTVEGQTYQSFIDNVARLINKVVTRLNLLYNIAVDGLKVENTKGIITIYMANEVMEKGNRLFNPTTSEITALQQIQKLYPGIRFASSLYLSENYADSAQIKDYIWLEQSSRMLIIVEPKAMQRFVYANVKNFTEEWTKTHWTSPYSYRQELLKGIGDMILGTPECVQFLEFGVSTGDLVEKSDLI